MAAIFNATKAKNQNTKTGIFEVKKYIKRFNIEELKIKHEAQRILDTNWVDEIIENWDERTCTPPVVVIEDGVNLVVDGQHRLEAMKKLGYKQVECFLIQDITASEAFLMINNIKPIEKLDKFIQRAKIHEYEATILSIFEKYEVELATSSEDGGNCFADAEFLLQENINFNALEASLEIIVNVVEYNGKISKQLLLKLYNLFNSQDIYNKVYTEMIAIKDAFSSEFKRNSKKTITHMQKRFPRSSIDEKIKEMIGVK